MRLLDLLLGRKLANYEGEERKISAIEGVPALGLGIWHILAVRKAGREGQLPTQLRRFRTAMQAAASGAF